MLVHAQQYNSFRFLILLDDDSDHKAEALATWCHN